MTTAPVTPWLQIPVPRPGAGLRLYCLPPAGAGPYFYRSWAAGLPAEIELRAVHLPGRENRYGEPRLTDYQAALAALYAAIRPGLDGPYALFGHSMGALFAHGLAVTAARLGDPGPEHLLLSGCGGPGTVPVKPGRAEWSDEDFVADLRRMGGTSEEVLAEPELLQLVLPVLRADYTLCDSYHQDPPSGPPLTCPLTILGGEDDHYTAADLARWRAVTTGPATQHAFPGGHFYLTGESAAATLATVTAALETAGPR
ncbi:thioesterase [Kitasatospora sp. MMS16-BH015]|uniref:thioesterase II family protein n=1 Tax=Kitasatospora sp. MMS16-BH015 TaxID=2018025 RepID=UPI000CA1D5E6|nr:alpha/beta fold hydrolase [Kitasatospora sp. MMS16-BH015]AUG82011.1 thioesterase [Kitasatospora sp. MMS16-BH015]